MDKVFSPKRLQKEGKVKEAVAYYKQRYRESLEKGDAFLSALYLDEIAQTLIIGNEQWSFDQLRGELVKAAMPEDLGHEAKEQATLDIQVTLRKRFPKRFKDDASDEDGPGN